MAVGRLWAVVLFGILFGLFAFSLAQLPYFGPLALVEEAAHTYTSAHNYLTYGFWSTMLLQDFSTSSDPADHPYAYNHMPPGPDLLTAVFLKVTGRSYRLTRLALAVLSLVGLVFYFKFAGLTLGSLGFPGAGALAVLFLSPHHLFSNFDRHNTAALPFLMFAPLVALHTYYRTGRRRYLWAALAVTFLSSLYLEYIALSAVIFSWILLYATRLFTIDRRHLLAMLAAIAGGICLHLVQNLAYLGPTLFWQELSMVVSNRVSGYPTKEAMKEFYQAVGLVHHGARPVEVRGFLAQLAPGFIFPGRGWVFLLVVLCAGFLAWTGKPSITYDSTRAEILWRRDCPRTHLREFVRLVGRLTVWAGGAITLPLVLFPAFAQEVSLHGNGTTLFFLGIPATAVLLRGVDLLVERMPSVSRTFLSSDLRSLAGVALVLGLGVSVLALGAVAAQAQASGIRSLVKATMRSPYRVLGEIRDRFHGHSYMTNISTTTVGFLVREAGFGVCNLEAVLERSDIDPAGCDSVYMRRRDHHTRMRPRYFFLFRAPELFPGFSDCLPSGFLPGQERGGDTCLATLERRLSARFAKVMDSQLVSVFDLHAPRAAPGG
jgi:hypothetical protein